MSPRTTPDTRFRRERGLDRPLSDIAQAKPTESQLLNIQMFANIVCSTEAKWLILVRAGDYFARDNPDVRPAPILPGRNYDSHRSKAKKCPDHQDLVINGGTDPNFWGTQLSD